MRKAEAPWVLLVIAVIAGGALLVKLQQVRHRLSAEQNMRVAEENRQYVEFHTQIREGQISRATAAAKHPIVVIGDSLTEGSQFPPDICGHPVIDAGISGIRVSRTLPVAEQLAQEHIAPAAVVIAVGVNDAIKTDWMDGLHQPAFKLAYRATISAALISTTNVLVANITPVDFDGSVGAIIDPKGRGAIEKTIRELVEELPVKPIELSDIRAESGKLQVDGVHLSPAGKDAWMKKIVTSVASSLGCSPAILATDAATH